jgi:hypothetical protein
MEKAAMPDFHQAIGHDRLEEPAEKLHDVELGGAEAGTAHFPVGERHRAVLQAHETVGGAGNLEARGGEGGASRVAVVMGLRADVPGDGLDLEGDVLHQARLSPLLFAERPGDGGERLDRDKEVRSRGTPGRAILGEAPARDTGVDVGVVLELPAPGVEEAGEPREGGADEALIVGQPLEGHGRRLQQGVRREAWRRAGEGFKRLQDGAGEEEVRPGELLGEMVLAPLLGCILLTLRTRAMATGMMDAVVAPTVLALRKAVAVRAALALWDGADDVAVGGGEVGVALQVFRRKGSEESAEGGHDRSLPSCVDALSS